MPSSHCQLVGFNLFQLQIFRIIYIKFLVAKVDVPLKSYLLSEITRALPNSLRFAADLNFPLQIKDKFDFDTVFVL